MKQQLARIAGRAGERWRDGRHPLEAWILVSAALLAVIAVLALAAASFTASIIAVAACLFAAGCATGVLTALAVARYRLRDKTRGGRGEP
jgi:hypothetical protein